MRTTLVLATIAATTLATPLAAQSTYVRVDQYQRAYAPPPPPPQREPYIPYQPIPLDVNVFDGLRIEAQVGYDHLSERGEDGRDGVSYGGEAGFDVALGSSVILGGYGGAEESSIKDCDDFDAGRVCIKAGRSFTAGGRIGFLLSPRALVYAKGGYTNGRIVGTLDSPTLAVREHQDLDGYHVGGGVEAAFGRHAYGKIEYVYTRLRGLETVDLDTGGTDRRSLDRHQVKAGLGLRM